MADVIAAPPPQRRSSSQASSSSRRSQKAKTVRSKASKRHSASSNATTAADLTSFPSLSPDSSPEGFQGQPALNFALSQALLAETDANANALDIKRGRQATLERLTSTLSQGSGRAALFDDSVSSPEIPGALHLADDAHIERLLERTGPVKLVRQFARDLAARDAEISKLRRRADARERELKRMLREVAVSSQDIERRLYLLENPPAGQSRETVNGIHRMKPSSSIYGLMDQAMLDTVGESSPNDTDLQATLRPHRNDSDARSGTSSIDSGQKRTQGSIRGWQDYLFGSTNGSRKTSRASSVMTDVDDVEEDAGRPRIPSNGNTTARRKGLDEQLFQPPGERSASLSGIPRGKYTSTAHNGDDSSIHSRRSSRSLTSWTVRLFAGNSQGPKDTGAVATSSAKNDRSRAVSLGQDKDKIISGVVSSTSSKGGLSAVAALKRINSYTGVNTLPSRSSNLSGAANRTLPQSGRRVPVTNVSQASGSERNTGDNTGNLGPVEMDAILPMESRPPTLAYIYSNYQPGELLTDRFGFIYDQRRKKRQREATLLRKNANRTSMAETINSFRSEEPSDEGDYDDHTRQLESSLTSPRPETPAEDPENDISVTKRWQDYLKIATRPTELLSHTPSAGPIVGITIPDDSKPRNSSVAIDKGGSLAVNSSSQPSASTSTVVADTPEFANSAARNLPVAATYATPNEQEPVKMLLEQLTELHDALQRERTAKWNEFLRKVRAERRREGEAAAAMDPDRGNMSLATPEASLADGEVVGIAGLGNKGKVGRAKWREFRSLVLGGVPVAHRAKIWAECSGASVMRVPGYYDDLVKGVGATDPDPSVVAQIEMDIHRTLTDNVFFRKGPGVAKLKDVLLAYSRRNPEVGYCQGMNLIAASLLLIMPTAEDAFWILASMIENILPAHYYDHGLLASRADQQVLRQYITEVLPKLSAHLDNLGIELEALTFQWFLSVFTDCLSAEALYRVWDVVLCLNVTSSVQSIGGNGGSAGSSAITRDGVSSANPNGSATAVEEEASSGGGSTFLFQVALALLKLNEQQLLTTCSTPAAVYTYVNHQMTNHAISIDGLIQASEALRNVVRREDVVARRAAALRQMRSGDPYGDGSRDGNSGNDTRGDS
jgi:hypothetical protein